MVQPIEGGGLVRSQKLSGRSRSIREHEHFTVADLILRKDIRTGFRIYLDVRVGKASLDRSEGFDFVGNTDKE
jgi:hypothetical protein